VDHSTGGEEEVQSLENLFVLRNVISTVVTTLASPHSSTGRLLIHVSLDFVRAAFIFNYMD
jgi:hypothetical protein